jgi:ketosteroid isomerase-like protein
MNKIYAFIIAMLMLMCWAGQLHAHGEKSAETNGLFVGTDTAPARAVIDFHAALSSGQVAEARALLRDDVLIFEGGAERSADEYASHHMLADMRFLQHMQQETLEHQVKIYGDTAVSSMRRRTTGTYKEKTFNLVGYETLHLVNTNTGWKISHIHWSR